MRLIKIKEITSVERGCSLVSLSTIWEQSACASHEYWLEYMLEICRDVLSSPVDEHQIPHEPVFKTISYLAKASKGDATFERAIKHGILYLL